MVWKLLENQSSICFWNPTVRSPLLYDTACWPCLLLLGHCLPKDWRPTLIQREAQRWYAWGLVSSTTLLLPWFSQRHCLSQQPTFHGWDGVEGDFIESNVLWVPGRPFWEACTRGCLVKGILLASSLVLWIVHPSAHCEDGEAECPMAVQ